VKSEVKVKCTPDDGRVTAETYVGWIEQNTKIKSAFDGLKTEN
jgi:hypothetical protein